MRGEIWRGFGTAAIAMAWATLAAAGSLEISKVDFKLVDRPGSDDRWYEVAVTVSVRSDGEATLREERFVDSVLVEIALAFESRIEGESRFDFYSSRADYPALGVGRHPVRFYLPPELVERDRLRGEPAAFEVVVTGAAEREATLYSRNLEGAGRLERFREMEAEAGGVNDGLLRPQWISPFALSYPDDTPTPRTLFSGQ